MTRRDVDARHRHSGLRRALIEAALELVAENGVGRITLAETARRAGVSVSAPYRHFAGRQALLAEIAEQGFTLLRDALLDDLAAAPGADPLSRLRRIAHGYVRWAAAHPGYYKVMFDEARGCDAEDLHTAGKRTFLVLVDAIEAAQDADLLRRQDPREVAAPLWSLLHGSASLLISGAFRAVSIRENADVLAARSAVALLNSLRTAAGR